MLAKCCNPSCPHLFRYLTDGKLFRLENHPALRQSSPTKEYFWLCPRCSATMTLQISPEGRVVPIATDGHNSLVTDRQKGLMLSDVSFFGRKEMAKVRGTGGDKRSAKSEH
jgi:hypothetical protein